MGAYNYDRLEEFFAKLIDIVSNSGFTESQLNEVKMFVGAGEYGVARDSLGAVVEDGNRHIPRSAYDLVVELAREMKLEELLTEQLKQQVIQDGSSQE